MIIENTISSYLSVENVALGTVGEARNQRLELIVHLCNLRAILEEEDSYVVTMLVVSCPYWSDFVIFTADSNTHSRLQESSRQEYFMKNNSIIII